MPTQIYCTRDVLRWAEQKEAEVFICALELKRRDRVHISSLQIYILSTPKGKPEPSVTI